MNIDIRKSIYNNFKESNNDDIISSINDAVNSNEEITLPGLGVFFELLWNKSNEEDRKNIVEKIKNELTNK